MYGAFSISGQRMVQGGSQHRTIAELRQLLRFRPGANKEIAEFNRTFSANRERERCSCCALDWCRKLMAVHRQAPAIGLSHSFDSIPAS